MGQDHVASTAIVEPHTAIYGQAGRLVSGSLKSIRDQRRGQTVPLHSAEAQLRSGQFKGIFRQTGYEHQAS